MRNHVNPLGAAFTDFRGKRPQLPADREVELEIGCADAQFLFERAALDASRAYLGLEIREELVDAVNAEAAVRGAPVQAVFCNANRHMPALFDDASIDRVYVNFPDPWFKRRHEKRRMIDDELGVQIARVLKPGGDLFVQTDVWHMALDALASMEALDDVLVNRAGAWSFWKDGNPYGVQSWREQSCERRELPIWRLLYRRR